MFFHEVEEAPPDPIFGLGSAFKADPRAHKVDLLVGIYKNEDLQPTLLPTIKRAEEEIISQDLVADYLPIDGMAEMVQSLGSLAFGERRWKEIHGRTYGAQTVGGTSALRIGGEFLAQEVSKKIYLPMPSWPNHRSVFERAGCQIENYAYYSKKERGFDLAAMLQDLNRMAPKSVVLLHAACHNPTGCDPTDPEWREISRVCKERQLFPFFDFAYQGFGDGIEKDRRAIEIFLEDGHEMLIAYSCSKNFSLYCQRVGVLFVVDSNSSVKAKVGSQVKRIIRALYSNPPAHGAKIVAHILKSPLLREIWEEELEAMRIRMSTMRLKLVDKLSKKTDYFESLRSHKGMFSFADLDQTQVRRLRDEFAVYIIDSGRISVAGLNSGNLDYVVDSILAVCS